MTDRNTTDPTAAPTVGAPDATSIGRAGSEGAAERGYTTIYEMAERDPMRAALRIGLFLGTCAVFGVVIGRGSLDPIARTTLVLWFGCTAVGMVWRARYWHRQGRRGAALACVAYGLLFAAVAVGETLL